MHTKIQSISSTQSENFKVQVSGLEKRIDRIKKSQGQIKESIKEQYEEITPVKERIEEQQAEFERINETIDEKLATY